MLGPGDTYRAERRAAARASRRRRRRIAFLALASLAVAVVVLVGVIGSSSSADRDDAHATPAGGPPTSAAGTPSARAGGSASRLAAGAVSAGAVSAGPLSPASAGGLPALWAPQNVVGTEPGTAAAYAAAAKLRGLPGFLLIADRGNNRILVVDPQHRIVFRFPTRADLAAGRKLFYNDDTFVEPGGTKLIANEEDNHAIIAVGIADHSLHVLFGHPGQAGSDSTHLHTPDDAYQLPDGSFTVADAYNCRILFVKDHRIVKQFGHSGDCRHDPPKALGPVNGDTPLPDGGVLVSEIPGSWIDDISATGRVRYAVQAPVGYPSDPQPLPGGRILLADYSSPGHVVIIDHHGHVIWRYGPTHGYGRLDHPSLAMPLPNGDIAVNDDYRNRVIVIDPRLNRIVWQYGHTDVGGTAPGFLHIPDGMDFIPATPSLLAPVLAGLHGIRDLHIASGAALDWGAVIHP